MSSWLVQRTVVPAGTEMVAGEKLKLSILTSTGPDLPSWPADGFWAWTRSWAINRTVAMNTKLSFMLLLSFERTRTNGRMCQPVSPLPGSVLFLRGPGTYYTWGLLQMSPLHGCF